MARDVDVKDLRAYMRSIQKEGRTALRREANRVRKFVRQTAPKRSGNLRRKVKVRSGVDQQGPWARVLTTARRTTTSEDGKRTMFRYGLAIQQKQQYLEKGLRRTPRR